MPETTSYSWKIKWQQAWADDVYRKRTITGLVLLAITLTAFPFFFQFIEKRNGTLINDWVLNWLPAYNVSVPIFIVIWAATLFTCSRCLQDPHLFLTLLWSYVIVSLSRIAAISLVALDPPHNLVELKDPISNTFYGMKVVTRDLFYSGHTSSVFLMFLCLKKTSDKLLVLAATLVVGLLLLVQHVHYTVDILGAMVFPYIIYRFTKKALGSRNTF